MTIEIFGAGFGNKGAELMLRTTVARLREADPGVRLAVEPGREAPYERRAELALAHVFPSPSLFPGKIQAALHRFPAARAIAFAPLEAMASPGVRRALGLVPRRACDALVDISGYAFGDGFSWIKTRDAALRAGAYARRGRPVVFMPQMFGPFRNPKVRTHFLRCCEHATRIYARERPSYEAVRELIGDDPRLRIAPDITIFGVRAEHAFADEEPAPYACIVPNERMLDQGKKDWGDSYMPRLIAAATEMHAHGLRPTVLVHSGDAGDERLAAELLARLEAQLGPGAAARFHHPDPRVLKAFIAGSRFLVGSRFHAIVAAFSSGVPGVALGWAHKYEALASDFGVPELQHTARDEPDHLVSLVRDLCDGSKYEAFRRRIVASRDRMRADSEAMWQDVYAILGLRPGAPAESPRGPVNAAPAAAIAE